MVERGESPPILGRLHGSNKETITENPPVNPVGNIIWSSDASQETHITRSGLCAHGVVSLPVDEFFSSGPSPECFGVENTTETS